MAVSGEVRSPADYTLNGPLDTIRDLIQRAGGMTPQASPEIVLTPAAEGSVVPAKATANYSAASYNSSSGTSNKNTLELNEDNPNLGQSLIIDLSRDSHQSRYLDLPVRPGDTIFVPAAGTVSTARLGLSQSDHTDNQQAQRSWCDRCVGWHDVGGRSTQGKNSEETVRRTESNHDC